MLNIARNSCDMRILTLGCFLLVLAHLAVAPPPSLRGDQRWVDNQDCPRGGVYKTNGNSIRCHCWGHQGYICEPDSNPRIGFNGNRRGNGGGGGDGCPPSSTVCVINNNSNTNSNTNQNDNRNKNQNGNGNGNGNNRKPKPDYGDYTDY